MADRRAMSRSKGGLAGGGGQRVGRQPVWNTFLNESVPLCTITHKAKRSFLILYLTSYDRSQLHARALKNIT